MSLRGRPQTSNFIMLHPGIAQRAPAVDLGFPWWLRLHLNMFFIHPAIRRADPRRSSTSLLGTKLHPGERMVSLSGPQGPALDVEGRFRLGAQVAGHSWPASHNRASAVVALFHEPALGSEWTVVLRAAVHDRPVAAARAAHMGGASGGPLDRHSVCFAELPHQPQLDPLWRPAAVELLHHGVRRRPVSIFTGFMQSPAISNSLRRAGRILNRQAMRSIHFISFARFITFILMHG